MHAGAGMILLVSRVDVSFFGQQKLARFNMSSQGGPVKRVLFADRTVNQERKYRYACRGRVRPVVPLVLLAHAACICYQIVLHGSHVASLCRVVNAVFACNAGFGGSLNTSKA
jgi:hypothetical protein